MEKNLKAKPIKFTAEMAGLIFWRMKFATCRVLAKQPEDFGLSSDEIDSVAPHNTAKPLGLIAYHYAKGGRWEVSKGFERRWKPGNFWVQEPFEVIDGQPSYYPGATKAAEMMPRKFSRSLIAVDRVRYHRLFDVTEHDAVELFGVAATERGFEYGGALSDRSARDAYIKYLQKVTDDPQRNPWCARLNFNLVGKASE